LGIVLYGNAALVLAHVVLRQERFGDVNRFGSSRPADHTHAKTNFDAALTHARDRRLQVLDRVGNA
jgi:hypothetical protein